MNATQLANYICDETIKTIQDPSQNHCVRWMDSNKKVLVSIEINDNIKTFQNGNKETQFLNYRQNEGINVSQWMPGLIDNILISVKNTDLTNALTESFKKVGYKFYLLTGNDGNGPDCAHKFETVYLEVI